MKQNSQPQPYALLSSWDFCLVPSMRDSLPRSYGRGFFPKTSPISLAALVRAASVQTWARNRFRSCPASRDSHAAYVWRA